MLEADPFAFWLSDSCCTSLVLADAPTDGLGVLAYARHKDQSVQAPQGSGQSRQKLYGLVSEKIEPLLRHGDLLFEMIPSIESCLPLGSQYPILMTYQIMGLQTGRPRISALVHRIGRHDPLQHLLKSRSKEVGCDVLVGLGALF